MRWAIFILGVLALLLFLKWQFPYAVQGQDAHMRILYLLVLLAFVGSGVVYGRRGDMSQSVKYAFIWLGILLLLVLGYSFRDGFTNNRLMAELIPHRAQIAGDGTMTIRSGEGGHFHVEAEINGVPVRFMMDTGASDIVLAPADAARVGFPVESLNYSRTYHTANGVVKGAPVKLDSLRIGSIQMRDIPASVNGAQMDQSLLGMTFLNRLKSYSVEGNTLKLVP
jgi:aspartyl protease family protein